MQESSELALGQDSTTERIGAGAPATLACSITHQTFFWPADLARQWLKGAMKLFLPLSGSACAIQGMLNSFHSVILYWTMSLSKASGKIAAMNKVAHMAAGAIFDLAKQAYTRAGDRPTDQSPGQMDALVAVILSVAAAEAVINEIAELSGVVSVPPFSEEPTEVKNLASLLTELEDARAPLTTKYMFARWVLTGQPYDRGSQPYQDFALLVEWMPQAAPGSREFKCP